MKKTRKNKRKLISPFTFCMSVVCVLLVGFVLNSYISLNELTLQSQNKKKELEELESKISVLNVQIDRKNSLASIEEMATEQLGMVKLESFRIHTVNLAENDSVEITPEKEKNTFLDGVVNSFNILYEYLN